MKRHLIRLVLAPCLALLATTVHAVWRYDPYFTGGSYEATASFNGSVSTIGSSDMANASAPLTQFMARTSGFYWALQTELTKPFAEIAQQTGASLFGPSKLTGDITASVTGMPDGNLSLRLSGISFSVALTGSKSQWFGVVNCTSSIKLDTISLQSVYNPYTGAVTNTSATYVPSQYTSCDNTWSWVPFIGDLINNASASLVGTKILGKLSSWSGSMLDVAPQKAYLAFTDAIQPGIYMIGSLDAGMYLKNNIQNLYVGKQVSVTIPNENKYEPSSTYVAPGRPSFRGARFSIQFSDASTTVAFAVDQVKRYGWSQAVWR